MLTTVSVRQAIDIGAHRENRVRFKSNLLEDQLRKRALWLLYSFDSESARSSRAARKCSITVLQE